MMTKPNDSSDRVSTSGGRADRRSFLLGIGAAAVSARALDAQLSPSGASTPGPALPDPLREPASVTAFVEGRPNTIRLTRSGGKWQGNDVEVSAEARKGKGGQELAVFVSAPKSRLTRLRLRWHGVFPAGCRFLGDAWERSYGDLEWRGLAGERLMPWYFLALSGAATHGYGVKTGAASICYWQADAGGVTLWLDVSNGGGGVELGERRLEAATVVARKGRAGESALSAARAFCRVMCEKPLLAAQPIYGSNNWYYAYGQNTSAEATLKDAALMAELAPASVSNRPFVVIDMGWGAARDGAGPVAETTKGFPDMPGLAAKMKAAGVRPGIWTRPTLTTEKIAESWRLPPAGGRPKGALITLDPSIPEALDYMAASVAAIRGWGYELIKHDYSTFDLTGRWGFEMGPELTASGWHFQNRAKTNAEIVLDLYRAIRKGAGDAVLIGCNTIGHLAAGLVEAQRIGDDTSGREWSRTRKMGVNTLAFRMAQHNTFFAADADCVPLTREIPWNLTRQWLDLVARSGTALFISADPAAVKEEHKPALKAALAAAARPIEPGAPLDWMETTFPERWRLEGKPVRYDWYAED
jgi:alpha-galactosidase